MERTCLIKPYFEGPNIKPEEGEWCLKSDFEKLEGKVTIALKPPQIVNISTA